MKQIYYITGADTGVGKTVLACLLVKSLRQRGIHAAALKPICSGGRNDARQLCSAMDGLLALDEINPWHFRAPIAPVLAARQENKKVKSGQVLAHIRSIQKGFDVLVVEGAGGLLSPMGVDFNSRDLILGLRATPIIVAQNKLGVVNHLLLTLEALPKKFRDRARIVLMSSPKPDSSAATNAKLFAEFFPAQRTFSLPWLGKNFSVAHASTSVATALRDLSCN